MIVVVNSDSLSFHSVAHAAAAAADADDDDVSLLGILSQAPARLTD